MRDVFVRDPFNYDRDAASLASGISTGPGMAQQQFRDECDINTIVRRFGLTGEMPVSARMPSYGDFTGISDYREALHAVRDAEASFMELPAPVRERFRNDPALFVDFCLDPSNLEEARKLGLAKPAPAASAPVEPGPAS